MRRIISLVPSLTETVAKLGDPNELVGITKFCTHPRGSLKHATILGGTKDPDLNLISQLNPTHILTNLEENPTETLNWLSSRYPTLITMPSAMSHVPIMLKEMGKFLGEDDYALAGAEIDEILQSLQKPDKLQEAYYFIWKNPWMIAADNTYIKDVMSFLGFELIQPVPGRYPKVSLESLKTSTPMFFGSEPWPFRKRDLEGLPRQFNDKDLLLRIDGKLLSWYGSSTLELLRIIQSKRISRIYRPFCV